jgi:hypothetical protein
VEKNKCLAAVAVLAVIAIAILLSQCGHERRTDADPASLQPRDDAAAY